MQSQWMYIPECILKFKNASSLYKEIVDSISKKEYLWIMVHLNVQGKCIMYYNVILKK